jgi:hypothetical protein
LIPKWSKWTKKPREKFSKGNGSEQIYSLFSFTNFPSIFSASHQHNIFCSYEISPKICPSFSFYFFLPITPEPACQRQFFRSRKLPLPPAEMEKSGAAPNCRRSLCVSTAVAVGEVEEGIRTTKHSRSSRFLCPFIHPFSSSQRPHRDNSSKHINQAFKFA